MSKRFISDIAFILIILISMTLYFTRRELDPNRIVVCVLSVITFIFIFASYFENKRNDKKIAFSLIMSMLMLLITLSFMMINYREALLDDYLNSHRNIKGVIYFDDPIHKKGGNLLAKIPSRFGISISYKLRIYDAKSHFASLSDGYYIDVAYDNLYIKKKSNYGEFDYKNYLKGNGVHASMMVKSLIDVDENITIYTYRERFLKWIYNSSVEIASDRDKGEFIYALISGSKAGLDNDVLENFKMSGTLHLLTVSGFHFGLIYMLLERFMFYIKTPRNIKLALLIFIMILYYIVTPMKFSCFRALVMIIILTVSKLINRQFDFMNALSFIVILSLVLNPYVLYDLSFLLTYFACIGIGVVYKSFSRIEKYIIRFPLIIKKSISVFVLSISIQLSIAICFLFLYSDINLLSALINIPLSFLVSILMSLVMPFIIIANLGLIDHINDVFNLMSCIIDTIYKIVGYFSKLDEFIYVFSTYRNLLLVLIVLFVTVLYIKQNVSNYKEIDIGVIISIAIIVTIIPIAIFEKNHGLEIVFNDVGQGDSAMVITEDGISLLIDLGDGKVDVSKLAKTYGLKKIDILIFSHGHKDHIAGGEEWASDLDLGLIVSPLHMKGMLEKYDCEKLFIDSRKSLHISDLELDILPIYLDEDNANDNGIVVKLKSDELDILFTGDIEKGSEELLVGMDILKSIDILKVAHHGSNTSSTQAFLDSLSPSYAVVPVGINNRYGHPSEDVIERYKDMGVEVIILKDSGQTYFTYKDGFLSCESYFKAKK